MQALPLSPQVFSILSGLVEEKLGLCYDKTDQEIFGDKVGARAQDAGFESLLDYYYFLRYDDADGRELSALADALVVGETYFFRELPQLELLTNELVPALLARRQRARIWCAACATGEEPLSVAMLLAAKDLLGRVELVASDVSERALARAKEGRFTRRAIRAPVESSVSRYLQVTDTTATLDPALIHAVDWRRVNLLDDAAVRSLGTFDAILMRNVLIYFRDAMASRVACRVSERLAPGGTLFVGTSESLLRFGTSLVCEELSGVFVYRKAT